MKIDEVDTRSRIASLVESVKGDRARSQELFHYVWTMICVRRGLLRVVREADVGGSCELLLEEVRTGGQRVVTRPSGMDSDLEGLAVQALARILGDISTG